MRLAVQHRLLAMLMALAVLGGFAHQVIERFTTHRHCETAAHECGGHAPEEDSAPQDDGCNHLLCHHSILAVLELPAPTVPMPFHLAEMLGLVADFVPDTEPAEIDHPPQLA